MLEHICPQGEMLEFGHLFLPYFADSPHSAESQQITIGNIHGT
jgi:hypothetical protein